MDDVVLAPCARTFFRFLPVCYKKGSNIVCRIVEPTDFLDFDFQNEFTISISKCTMTYFCLQDRRVNRLVLAEVPGLRRLQHI